ncbi:type II toxin-antitoxin system RelE/ParE family toxin [Pasteurella skyensis]|uniref:Type II toxin-antitoxin system RelE/ParE family toxin n=2 Tax=Phocoenobacter skyensis TaxID=97481 RepID=A0AAJ6P1K9_9PAST|nr:type II toxin-antitoxin system RelE/ParE family toxin [Pasteurella skyensis]MDP8163516.1 type II toxin-antitoxin system RelE/ParE family toxin [Pasteurella skyensis]MDP8173837.1 type II toxin-antitoxin system RelE/ParE family toxin [Pasteurella skyensis]MDP8177894.1 type II toxin-antitoxin system RelE/ParE family toxin [Pasteurella skyensis]MDP8179988.1 type II toxin-antitoxin system RelE/ParE family toxin [Pasteurella skyensis]MDP8184084.1 type II toxin-antitoxin system RelE/ParE family to
MKYQIVTSRTFIKSMKKLDIYTQKQIKSWIIKNNDLIASNPRIIGKNLKGNLKNYWRYRIGDYRLLAQIEDDKLILILLSAGHRKNIYNQQK